MTEHDDPEYDSQQHEYEETVEQSEVGVGRLELGFEGACRVLSEAECVDAEFTHFNLGSAELIAGMESNLDEEAVGQCQFIVKRLEFGSE